VRALSAGALIGLLCAACSGSTEPKDLTAPARVVLSQDTLTWYQGIDFQLPTATVYNSNNQVLADQVTWTSSDPADVQLFGNGYGRAGQTLETMTLTATSGKASANLKFTIVLEPVVGFQITPVGPAVYGHDSLQLVATPYGPYSSVLTGRAITWMSLDPSLATVTTGGLAKAKGIGTARFTVASGTTMDTVLVTADTRLVAKVVVSPDTLVMVPGDHSPYWTVHTYDATNTELPGRPIKWSSSDTSIATADRYGAFAKEVGSATIIAQADTGSLRIPITIAKVSFIAVTAGSDHACGLAPTHQAWCWGSDDLGGLGVQPAYGDTVPQRVSTTQTFTTIEAAGGFTCALVSDGTPWCWGRISPNGNGSAVPSALPGVHLVSLSMQWNRACGLDASGTMWCWGPDAGTLVFTPPTACGTTCNWTPVTTSAGHTWSAVSAGPGGDACALDTAGAAFCWGSNPSGQVGDNTLADTTLPAAVSGALTFSQISAGSEATCGVTTSGDAYCWGSNLEGTLGTGVAAPNCSPGGNPCSMVPVAVAGGVKFTMVRVAQQQACGIAVGGAVWCWGNFSDNGTPSSPQQITGGLSFTSLEINHGYNCGIATDGKAYCWQFFAAPVAVVGQ
jgi:alpha-tubulin suppressor-like RCC1 family protein